MCICIYRMCDIANITLHSHLFKVGSSEERTSRVNHKKLISFHFKFLDEHDDP